jgi:hypothetical protein
MSNDFWFVFWMAVVFICTAGPLAIIFWKAFEDPRPNRTTLSARNDKP